MKLSLSYNLGPPEYLSFIILYTQTSNLTLVEIYPNIWCQFKASKYTFYNKYILNICVTQIVCHHQIITYWLLSFFFPTFRPYNIFFFQNSLYYHPNQPFPITKNRKCVNGSIWLNPFVGLKSCVELPLTKINIVGDFKHACIHLTLKLQNPNLSKM